MIRRSSIRTVVLGSGRGSNFAALLCAWKEGSVPTEPVLTISNHSDSGVLGRTREEGISWLHLSSHTHPDEQTRDQAMLDAMLAADVDLVLTLGYLRKVGQAVLDRFRDRVLNIHPSLLPRHGGQGLYGLRVHQAVLDAGERETGVTIHQVTPHYDEGRILARSKVQVASDDSAETLAGRVLKAEHELLVMTLAQLDPDRLDASLSCLHQACMSCLRAA